MCFQLHLKEHRCMPLNPFLNRDHGLKVIQGKKHPESVPVLVPYIGAPARKEFRRLEWYKWL